MTFKSLLTSHPWTPSEANFQWWCTWDVSGSEQSGSFKSIALAHPSKDYKTLWEEFWRALTLKNQSSAPKCSTRTWENTMKFLAPCAFLLDLPTWDTVPTSVPPIRLPVTKAVKEEVQKYFSSFVMPLNSLLPIFMKDSEKLVICKGSSSIVEPADAMRQSCQYQKALHAQLVLVAWETSSWQLLWSSPPAISAGLMWLSLTTAIVFRYS